MATLNTHYLTTNRGIIKVIQIIIGFIICSLLCGNWSHSPNTCFNSGWVGFASGLNTVVVVINIVLLVLNFVDLSIFHLERTYSVTVTVLFLVATILLTWKIIEGNTESTFIISAVLLGVQFVLFLWDVKIIQGEAPN